VFLSSVQQVYEGDPRNDYLLNRIGTAGISLLVVALAAIGILIIVLYSESRIDSISESIIEKKVNEVDVLASRASLRLSDAATILRISSNLPQITSSPNASLVDETLHGVPQSSEANKRYVARTIMEEYPNFETISFMLPNGDLYLVEPFESQKNVTLKNFAFRDYYKGVLSTDKPYLSQIIKSNATGHIVSVIAVPVHDQINGSLIGIWIGALNLRDMSQAIQELGVSSEFVEYVDHRGHQVVSSNGKEFLDLIQGNTSLLHEKLTGFQAAMVGKSGYTAETINGVKMFVAYSPVHAISTTWAVLSFEPYDHVFSAANSLRLNAFSMSLILGGAGAAIIFLLNRSFSTLNKLAKELTNKDKELRKRNEELLTVERAKDEFMSMINHELKTPLVPIKGYADMLKSPKIMGELNEKQKKAVNSISYNIGKLELLISDILDVYKLDMGKLRLSKKDVKVDELINTNMIEFKPIADQKSTEMVADIQYDGIVYCDQRRIDQVITNMIKNSIDFVPADTGKIILRVTKKENKIAFSVEDNGTGIPSDKVDSLFKKFYQIDTSMTRKHGGTGLGLAISKGIVEAHGGEMWIDKEYVGGAKFIFTLPIKDEVS
jgi:signal transduction histidine kinase